ncbi:MAG: hypothetical protein IKT58_00715 [Oscillospiraceae bacterium]|nr:hypothetical protein [Oscillospiraceae bacterium]
MANDGIKKFGDSMSRAFTKISVKTSSTIEKSKIRMHIENLEKDIQRIMSEIGEEVYALWSKDESINDSVIAKLEAVKGKKTEIEQLTEELSAIDDRDSQILGTKVDPQPQPQAEAAQVFYCPNCKSERDPAAKFCRKCGFKLQ